MSQTTKGQVRYVGPFQSVYVPLPDGGWSAEVQHGEVFTTTQPHAASLLEQAENWAALDDEKDGEK